MANPRQRKKSKSNARPSARKSRAFNPRRLEIADPTIRAAWDPTLTVKQNFAALGLAADVNSDVGSAKMRHRVLDWQAKRAKVMEAIAEQKRQAKEAAEAAGVLDMTPMDLGEEEIFGELNKLFATEQQQEEANEEGEEKLISVLERVAAEEASARKSAPKKRPLNEDETNYMQALVKKHGSNFVAMAKDLKLNNLQYTPKQLEALYERL